MSHFVYFALAFKALANAAVLPRVGNTAASDVFCETLTVYSATTTRTLGFEITQCTKTRSSTVAPTSTIYTGAYTSLSLSTETLRSYGDLYTPGELASTPTCPPTGCSGTSTTTVPGTVTTSITAGPEGPYHTYSAVCTETETLGSTVSTTQHLMCAPTNLISTVEGHGIRKPVAMAGASTKYAADEPVDASACCQACLDSEDCAVSYSVTNNGFIGTCGLVTAPLNSSVALQYSDSAAFEYSFVDPDDGGYRVQYGSGCVQPVVYEGDCVSVS